MYISIIVHTHTHTHNTRINAKDTQYIPLIWQIKGCFCEQSKAPHPALLTSTQFASAAVEGSPCGRHYMCVCERVQVRENFKVRHTQTHNTKQCHLCHGDLICLPLLTARQSKNVINFSGPSAFQYQFVLSRVLGTRCPPIQPKSVSAWLSDFQYQLF